MQKKESACRPGRCCILSPRVQVSFRHHQAVDRESSISNGAPPSVPHHGHNVAAYIKSSASPWPEENIQIENIISDFSTTSARDTPQIRHQEEEEELSKMSKLWTMLTHLHSLAGYGQIN
jgi:hypothetical protein